MLCCAKKGQDLPRPDSKKLSQNYIPFQNETKQSKAKESPTVSNNTWFARDFFLVEEKEINKEGNRINEKYNFPAQFKKAQLHMQANKFGYNAKKKKGKKPEHGQSQKDQVEQKDQPQNDPPCPCCNQPINDGIGINYATTDTAQGNFQLNTSTALFFSFIKMAICYSIIMFIIGGLYNLLTSLDGKYCIRHPDICKKSIFELLSTFNKSDDPKQRNDLQFHNFLCLVSVIVSILFFTYYKRKMIQMYKQIDQNNQTQDDYTIFVENIPILDFPSQIDTEKIDEEKFHYEKKLKEIFEKEIDKWIKQMDKKKHQQGSEGYIQKSFKELLKKQQKEPKDLIQQKGVKKIVPSISLCFDLSSMRKINQQRQLLMQKHLNSLKNAQQTKSSEKYNKQIKALNKIELQLCKKFASNPTCTFSTTNFVGKAFVSFEYEHYKQYIMQKYEDRQKFMYADTELVLSRASHPTDIEWLNMDVTDGKRFKKVVTAFVIVLMVLAFSAVALICIDKAKLQGIKEGNDISQETKIFNYSLTVLGSILTSLINNGIWKIIVALSGYEKHQTATNKIASQIVKAIIAQFINTVLVLYLIQVFNKRPYLSSAGLVVQASTYIVVSGFISIIINAMNFSRWVRDGIIFWKYGFCTKKQQRTATYQVKLNQHYKLPEFDITGRYIWYLLQIYTCMFYLYIVPVGILATAVIFGIQYWIDKVKLFKLSSEYKDLGYFLSKVIFNVFRCSLLIFTIGNLIFSKVIHSENQIDQINLISFGIAFIYTCLILFLPSRLEQKLYGGIDTLDQMSYSQCQSLQKQKQKYFDETYWKQNPATMFAKEKDIE